MKTLRLAALGLALMRGVATSTPAQEKKPSELSFRVSNLASQPSWRVAKVAPSGELTLKFEGYGDASMMAMEGYFFAIPVGGEVKGFARILVTDVDTKEIVATTSPEAAKALGEGTAVRLVRPMPGVTKRLKSVPEFVAFAKDQARGNDALMAARDPINRARSTNNLKQIGLAMHNFYAANDVLPPAILRSPDGKPWVSWRVLILPYLGEQELYKEYDLSQPWDSEKNLKLLDRMPAVYRDPVYGEKKTHFANYAVLVGEKTLFTAEGVKMSQLGNVALHPKMEGAVGFNQVLDGTSNTICAAPVSPDRKIPWTKPEDITFDDDFPPIGQPQGIAAPFDVNGEKVTVILMMDGSVRSLSAKIQKPTLDALCTKAGGEIIAAEAFADGPPEIRIGVSTITITIDGNNRATATIR